MFKPTKIILHCSATPDYDEDDDRFDFFGRDDIDKWHKERGWNGIGYHYVIRRTGKIEIGRDKNTIGAHCEGHNHDSIGICYIGTRSPTKMQIISIRLLASMMQSSYGFTEKEWFGHQDFNSNKECPGIETSRLREWILQSSSS